jgi:hypothetical protein
MFLSTCAVCQLSSPFKFNKKCLKKDPPSQLKLFTMFLFSWKRKLREHDLLETSSYTIYVKHLLTRFTWNFFLHDLLETNLNFTGKKQRKRVWIKELPGRVARWYTFIPNPAPPPNLGTFCLSLEWNILLYVGMLWPFNLTLWFLALFIAFFIFCGHRYVIFSPILVFKSGNPDSQGQAIKWSQLMERFQISYPNFLRNGQKT